MYKHNTDPEELRNWLKGRSLKHLRVSSNALSRTLAFVDLNTSEYIVCSISAFIGHKDLYKKFIKLSKVQNKDPGMITKWISMVCNDSD